MAMTSQKHAYHPQYAIIVHVSCCLLVLMSIVHRPDSPKQFSPYRTPHGHVRLFPSGSNSINILIRFWYLLHIIFWWLHFSTLNHFYPHLSLLYSGALMFHGNVFNAIHFDPFAVCVCVPWQFRSFTAQSQIARDKSMCTYKYVNDDLYFKLKYFGLRNNRSMCFLPVTLHPSLSENGETIDGGVVYVRKLPFFPVSSHNRSNFTVITEIVLALWRSP